MKGILVAIALVTSQAHAQYWQAPNKSGGRIVLTEAKCQVAGLESLLAMWTETADGKLLDGCWTLFADKVQVIYNDGARYTYSPASFERKEPRQGNTRGSAL